MGIGLPPCKSVSIFSSQLEDGVRVDEANVVTVDITVSNGVIHVIDAVITP